jgi:hypothetical protein
MQPQPEPGAYVAPARFVLTVLHRIDPEREADLFSGPERIDGYTRCGLPLLESELWRRMDSREGDSLCTGCLPAGCDAGVQPDLQEATLW